MPQIITKIQQKRANSPLINYKYFKVDQLKVDTASRKVSGYFAVFGNVDLAGDLIIKGAFTKSIQERGPGTTNGNKIAFLYQHTMSQPLGLITKLIEDDFGLYFEAIITDELTNPLFNTVLAQLKDGTLDQFSIGYNYVWDKIEYDADKEAFICLELYLAEGSVVTLSCNPLAQFEGMKAQDQEDLRIKLREDLETELKALSHPRQFKLRQLFSDLLALSSVQPSDTLKQEVKAAALSIDKPLDFGALANTLNN